MKRKTSASSDGGVRARGSVVVVAVARDRRRRASTSGWPVSTHSCAGGTLVSDGTLDYDYETREVASPLRLTSLDTPRAHSGGK